MDNILAIARNTYRESVRSKVLYSFFFFALFMVLVSTVFSTTTIGDRMKLLKDFGLAVISLSSVVFVVISGSSLLAKELQRRTVFNILAKPVPRYQFIAGKFLGLLVTSAVLVSLMGATLSTLLWCFEGAIDLVLIKAYPCIVLELAIVCAFAMLFSSIVITPMLNGLFTFGAFLAGRSISHLVRFSQDLDMPVILRGIARILQLVLPRLDQLYVANDMVYGVPISAGFLLWALCYGVGYCVIVLIIAVLIFRNRNFV